MAKPHVRVTIDRVKEVSDSIAYLANTRVLVGIPAVNAVAQVAAVRAGTKPPISLAAIGYIQENGAPEVHIPPRPHLVPGVKKVQQSSTIPRFKEALKAALEGKMAVAQKQLMAAGQEAADSVRAVIKSRIPPPLKEATIEARQRRRQSGKAGDVPLIDTGNLWRAYTFVLRKVSG
jgi:hypothetical protein